MVCIAVKKALIIFIICPFFLGFFLASLLI